jgi:hypothetical protein
MKTRNGFVSNSSTTSFCVYGVHVEDGHALLNKLMGEPKETKTQGCGHNFDRDKFKFCPECGEKAWNIEVEERNLYDDLPACFKKLNTGLDVKVWDGGENCGEGVYIGKDVKSQVLNKSDNIPDTLKQVEIKLKELFPDKKPRFYVDASTS